MQVELIKEFTFQAAHVNPAGGEGQRRVHGHGYRVEVVARGAVDARLGWLVDYGDVSAAFQPIFDALDHRDLRDVDGLADTTRPGLRAYILERMQAELPVISEVRVAIDGACRFEPVTYDGAVPRVRCTAECAHFLPELPRTHKCRRLHGHSFCIEVAGPEPEALIAGLETVYHAIDHRCLNDVPGLDNPTSEHVSRWIWEQVHPVVPSLGSVLVAETCTARCIYRGG